MEYGKVVDLLNSGNVPKQLSALLSISTYIQIYTPSEEFWSALIEHGLSSDNDHIREAAFRCVFAMYLRQFGHWTDVKTAIMSEISTADHPKSLRAALSIFNIIPKTELLLFFGSKEGAASILSGCTSDNLNIRAACVTTISPLLVDLWILLDGPVNPEGLIPTESTADGKRYTLDFKDLCLSLYKQFTSGLLGKSDLSGSLGTASTNDLQHPGCIASYFSAVAALLTRYNAGNCVVEKWVSALHGCLPASGCVVPEIVERLADKQASAALYPLIKTVIPRLCSDPYLIISNWENVCMSNDHLSGGLCSDVAALAATECLNGLFIAISHNLPQSTAGNVQLVTGLPAVMEFDVGVHSANEMVAASTASSRQGEMNYLNAVSLVEEWVTVHLFGLLSSPYPDIVVLAIDGCLELVQHPAFVHARYQVCPAISNSAIRIMQANVDASSSSQAISARGNAIGFVGWVHEESGLQTDIDWTAYNGNNTQPYSRSIEFQRLYEACLHHCSTGSSPIFETDYSYGSTVSTSLPALSASYRGASYFTSHIDNIGGRSGADAGAKSLGFPDCSPMSLISARCLYTARFSPRLLCGRNSVTSTLASLVGLLDLSSLRATPLRSDTQTLSCYPGLHIAQTRLVAEVAMLVLTDPSMRGDICSFEFIKAFISSSSIAELFSGPATDLGRILVTALCRAYIRLMPAVVLSVISKHKTVAKNCDPGSNSEENQGTVGEKFSTEKLSTDVSGSHRRGVGRWAATCIEGNTKQLPSGDNDRTSPSLQSSSDKGQDKDVKLDESSETARDNADRKAKLSEKLQAVYDDAVGVIETFTQIGVLLLSTFSSCLAWPCLGSSADGPALLVTSLYSELCGLLAGSRGIPSSVVDSISQWVTPMLVERTDSVLWMLTNEEIKSKTVRSQLCIAISQALSGLYGSENAAEKGCEILDVVKKDLFQYEEKETAQKNVMTSALAKGRLGLTHRDGSKRNTYDYHPSGNMCRQLQAIVTLEVLALHNGTIARAVLESLKDFQKLFQVNSLSPVLQVNPYYCQTDQSTGASNTNIDDVTLRGQMAGWSVATPAVVQRSYVATNRIMSQYPTLYTPPTETVPRENSTPALTRGVTNDMINVFSLQPKSAIGTSNVFLNDGFSTDCDTTRDLISGSRVSELGIGLAAQDTAQSVFTTRCGVGSSPVCADIGSDYSVFRMSDTVGDSKATAGGKSEAYGCVADVIAIIDDVQNGHLLSSPEQNMSSGSNLNPVNEEKKTINGYLSDILFSSTENVEYASAFHRSAIAYPAGGKLSQWRVLSGSSDVMTVMGCCAVDINSRTGTIKCRVINSSGFKIPFFSIQPMISSPIPSARQAEFSVVASMAANENHLCGGCEYILPGAMIERSWKCTFHHCFTCVLICFKIVYNDLIPEKSDCADICFELFSSTHFEKQTEGDGENKKDGDSRKGSLHRRHSSFSGSSALAAGLQSNNYAHIYSQPLEVRPMDLLTVYGGGCLSSMSRHAVASTFLTTPTTDSFGVPSAVFKSMLARMSISVVKRVICFQTQLPVGVSLQDAVNNSAKCTLADGFDIPTYTSMCSRVAMPCGACHSSWGRRFTALLGWCFQSAFGDEVCIKLTGAAISSQHSQSKVLWRCTVEIYSSSDDLASALVCNSTGTLRCLLGGLRVSLVAAPPRAHGNSFTVPELSTQKEQAQRDAEQQKVVQEAQILKQQKEAEATTSHSDIAPVKENTGFDDDPFASFLSTPAPPMEPAKSTFTDDIFAAFDNIPAAPVASTAPTTGFTDDILGLFSAPPAPPIGQDNSLLNFATPTFATNGAGINDLGGSLPPLGNGSILDSLPADTTKPMRAKHLPQHPDIIGGVNMNALSIVNSSLNPVENGEDREAKYMALRGLT